MDKPSTYRPDLEAWADELFLNQPIFIKRLTFGCPSYYIGRRLFAFLYEDGLGIKLYPERIQELINEAPDVYHPFNPGDGVMKNWVIIVCPEIADYDDIRPLITEALDHFDRR